MKFVRCRYLSAGLAAAGLLLLASTLGGGWALAQTGLMGDNGQPVEVEADQSIEVHDQQKAYVARGRAHLRRGSSTIDADTLVAYYREVAGGGGTEIFRILALGAVAVRSPGQTIFGQRGIYDIDRQVAVMTGDNLRLETRQDVVTARDALEYWDKDKLAVARGDALAVRADSRVSADTMVALITQGSDGRSDIERIDAKGNVVIVTKSDVLRGTEAVYDVLRNLAVITGDVQVTRGANQLNGAAAEVDFATGISRMLRWPGSNGIAPANQRVRGLFVPGQRPGEGLGLVPARP